MVQLYVDREGDTFNISVVDGVTNALIYDDLPSHLIAGLLDFIHGHYSELAIVVNIKDPDIHDYFISQSNGDRDFRWVVDSLNELEPGHWRQKSNSFISGDRTSLKFGTVVQILNASQLPAGNAKDVQANVQNALPSDSRSPLPKWLPLALTSAVSFGLGALFCGLF